MQVRGFLKETQELQSVSSHSEIWCIRGIIHINSCQNYLKNFCCKIWPWEIQHSSLSSLASSPSSLRCWFGETRMKTPWLEKSKILLYLYIYISAYLSLLCRLTIYMHMLNMYILYMYILNMYKSKRVPK